MRGTKITSISHELLASPLKRLQYFGIDGSSPALTQLLWNDRKDYFARFQGIPTLPHQNAILKRLKNHIRLIDISGNDVPSFFPNDLLLFENLKQLITKRNILGRLGSGTKSAKDAAQCNSDFSEVIIDSQDDIQCKFVLEQSRADLCEPRAAAGANKAFFFLVYYLQLYPVIFEV